MSLLTSIKRLKFYQQILEALAAHYNFNLHSPFEKLPQNIQDLILYGSNEEKIQFRYNTEGQRISNKTAFEGVLKYLDARLEKAENQHIVEQLENYQDTRKCTSCNGYRLKQEALCIKINDKNIGDICSMSIRDTKRWFETVGSSLSQNSRKIADRVVTEILKRIELLHNVGLGYLTLDRRSNTLSGGESQRIRLATQICSNLSSVLYVLDEPSIGLHQYDNDKLITTIKALRDQGNSVLVVEHDEETMRAADYIIEVGPGAGGNGGEIVACGSPEEIINNPNSLTGAYLSGKKYIPTPKHRRKGIEKCISIKGASSNNLNNIDVDIPLGKFIAFTGVSGSGKSTFVIDTLHKAIIKKLHSPNITTGAYDTISGLEFIDKVIEVDQSAIGRTPRSNPATYTNTFNAIRDWFASLPESEARGYVPSRFSFNVNGGRCEYCEGDGFIKIKMHFLPDVYIPCEECKGQRYNPETLQIKHKGVSIADALAMTCQEALSFFADVPAINEKLLPLCEVGLGYIQLGQSATTLSGGEAQRIKLAKELGKKSLGHTLYIFDEPTTGLHVDDIQKLINVFHKLVESNNTVIVIEHNIDVIKTADHIIDFGPYGGDKGGNVIAQGTPEEVIQCQESLTAQYLKKYMK